MTPSTVDSDPSEAQISMSARSLDGSSQTKGHLGQRHGSLCCNGCSKAIVGSRYNCVVCDDFDLCASCDALNVHPQHVMLRIARPLERKEAQEMMRHLIDKIKTRQLEDSLVQRTDTPQESKPLSPKSTKPPPQSTKQNIDQKRLEPDTGKEMDNSGWMSGKKEIENEEPLLEKEVKLEIKLEPEDVYGSFNETLEASGHTAKAATANSFGDYSVQDDPTLKGPKCATELEAVPTRDGSDTARVRKCRKRNVWLLDKTFDCEVDAEKAIEKEKCWAVIKSTETEFGLKRYYRCNRIKRRAKLQCPAGIYLLFNRNCENVTLYRNKEDHDHSNKDDRSKKAFSDEVRIEINKMFALHLKPKAILHRLAKMKGIKLPSLIQVNNYLKGRRRLKYPPAVKQRRAVGPDRTARRRLAQKNATESCSNEDDPSRTNEPAVDNIDSAPTQNQRKSDVWYPDTTFDCEANAIEAIKKEKCWSVKYTAQIRIGRKRFYRCNEIKRRAKQCPAGVYLLFQREKVTLFRKRDQHDHSNREACSKRIFSEEVQTEVDRMLDLHVNPRAILHRLSKMEGIQLPSKHQLNDYLTARRRAKYGRTITSQRKPGRDRLVSCEASQKEVTESCHNEAGDTSLETTATCKGSEANPAKKRKMNIWVPVETFDCAANAEEAVGKENCWSVNKTNETEIGCKRYYRCNQVKRRGKQCPASVYLLFDATSDDVILYSNNEAHDHSDKDRSKRPISWEVRAEIDRWMDLKPKEIMKRLARVEGIQLPSKVQLNNYLMARRRANAVLRPPAEWTDSISYETAQDKYKYRKLP